MLQNRVINAKTITCQYSEKEDRLLLSINYKDVENRVDFWLTRRFLLKLLPYMFEYATTTQTSKIINESSSRVEPTDGSTFVLTQKKPYLLDSVDFTPLGGGNIKVALKSLEKQIECIYLMDSISFNSFVELITNTAPTFEWGVSKIN